MPQVTQHIGIHDSSGGGRLSYSKAGKCIVDEDLHTKRNLGPPRMFSLWHSSTIISLKDSVLMTLDERLLLALFLVQLSQQARPICWKQITIPYSSTA